MCINQIFELSMVLNTEHFQKLLTRVYSKAGYLQEIEDEFIDTSLAAKGITIVYRDSQYKKKVRLIVNTSLLVDDASETDKLIRRLHKRIAEYFDFKYGLDNFTLSGVNLVTDIDVGSRANVSAYIKVLQRIGKVKGFSPVSYDFFDKKFCFCLSGNSNNIDFLLFDLERAVIGQLQSADVECKEMQLASEQTKGTLRAEVRLTKPKAIRVYTEAADVSDQIVDLTKNSMNVFMDTFTRIVPFGDFRKKEAAVEMIRSKVADDIMQRRMLRLLALIPEKKSLYLAQKTMKCRNTEKVMEAFARISLSPVTLSKRHDVKYLQSIYSYM